MVLGALVTGCLDAFVSEGVFLTSWNCGSSLEIPVTMHKVSTKQAHYQRRRHTLSQLQPDILITHHPNTEVALGACLVRAWHNYVAPWRQSLVY